MGFAKYREDDISRRGGTSREVLERRVRNDTVPPSSGAGQKKTGSAAAPISAPHLKDFLAATPRPLPVILMLDVSGSMSANGKMAALNIAVEGMLRRFAAEDATRAAIHVAIITFGGDRAHLHQQLEIALNVTWQPPKPSGKTPLGDALGLATQLIEDHNQVPGRAYRPALVLVSDGQPTDDWQEPLSQLLSSTRAAKASRFALGIGDDADKGMLSSFLATDASHLFMAHDAPEIISFFKWITMSVTARSRSAKPDSVVVIDRTEVPDFDF